MGSGRPTGRPKMFSVAATKTARRVTFMTTRGAYASVDAADWPLVAPHKWTWNGHSVARQATVREQAAGLPRSILLHRWILMRGARTPTHVDHIDRNPLNNMRSNLRLCTPQQNLWNRGPQRDNALGYKGVTEHGARPGLFVAVISKGAGHNVHLGCFRTPEAAARCYDAAARERHGEFAYQNFPRKRRRPAKSRRRGRAK